MTKMERQKKIYIAEVALVEMSEMKMTPIALTREYWASM